MQKLVEGIHNFQANIFSTQRELFERLASGQNPDALFITCADSRINPNLITQTNPGDLFILRNAGNIVPPYGAGHNGGEAATIEFAIKALNIKDIIICGHSHCGAMKGLLKPELLVDLPATANWLYHAEKTWRILFEKYRGLEEVNLLKAITEENVLIQLKHLATHPAVAQALDEGTVKLHAWMYKLESGEVFAYDPACGQFLPLADGARQHLPTPVRPEQAI